MSSKDPSLIVTAVICTSLEKVPWMVAGRGRVGLLLSVGGILDKGGILDTVCPPAALQGRSGEGPYTMAAYPHCENFTCMPVHRLCGFCIK